MAKNNKDWQDPKKGKKTACNRVCGSNLCVVLAFLFMAIGVAITVPIILLSGSVRNRFPPDMKWWQKTIIYQIDADTFYDSDDDGVGDLTGISLRLDHLSYLRVKTIWLSRFLMTSDGADQSVVNFTEVDPRVGNLTSFEELVRNVHKKGMRIIVDFVPGHTSAMHPWFQQSQNREAPFEDFYVWAPPNKHGLSNGTVELQPSSNPVSMSGQTGWEWSSKRLESYFSLGTQQPALNFGNAAVVEKLKEVLRFWLDTGVDGIFVQDLDKVIFKEHLLRTLPGSNQTNSELLPDITDLSKMVFGWKEVLDSYMDDDDDTDDQRLLLAEQFDPGETGSPMLNSGVDMFVNDQRLVLDDLKEQGNLSNSQLVYRAIKAQYDAAHKEQWAGFSTHVCPGVAAVSVLGEDFVDALNVLVLTVRGTPVIRYGEELGLLDRDVASSWPASNPCLRGKETRWPLPWDDSFNAGFSNTSSPWTTLYPDYHKANVQSEKISNDTTPVQVFRDLVFYTRNEPSFRYGLFHFVDVNPGILTYKRTAEDFPHCLVVINFSNITVKDDFSQKSVKQGQIKVVSSKAANQGRFVKGDSVTLKEMELHPGDALVIEMNSSG